MAKARSTSGKKNTANGANERTMKAEINELVKALTTARRPWTLRKARQAFETSYVEYMIRCNDGNRLKAAEKLDIGFSTLKEKIRKT